MTLDLANACSQRIRTLNKKKITLALQLHGNKIYEVYSMKLPFFYQTTNLESHSNKTKNVSEFPSFVPPGWDSNNGNPLSRYGVPH